MTQCPTCNSKLVTDGLSSGQQFRCANCNSFSRFGKTDRVAADRLAWRSFWLGIASILLLTLTGIPAVYYGVRSLLRMRFVRAKRGDQAAAILGVGLGGFFGMFIGFLVFCVVLVAILGRWTSSETKDPELVASNCSKFFEFDHQDLKPLRANSILDTQFVFQFSDNPNSKDESVNVALIHLRKSIQSSDASMLAMLRRKRLGGKRAGRSIGTKVFEWSMDGEPMDVKRTIYSEQTRMTVDGKEDEVDGGVDADEIGEAATSDSLETESAMDTDTYYYFGYQKIEGAFYGIGLTHCPTQSGLSEEDVKAMFESVRLIKSQP